MAEKKTVMIVDDHPLFREGLKSILSRHSKFEIIAEAKNGFEGISYAKKMKPELVTMDLSLPDKSGIEVTREIMAKFPGTYIMILSMHSKINYITEAFKAGAKGYIVKESATEKLVEGLNAISNNEYFLDTSLSPQVIRNLVASKDKKAKITDAGYGALTPREQEIMRLVAEGLSSKVIAEKLFISPKTVENHRTNIMNKLDIHSTLELVRYAARLGLIDVEIWKG
ncbi:MAG: response regulator transcription factor [Deltaproteobacteria bacterium]|nr:response regulator transcription factor [Deltaproteobacteria bacterium]